MFITERKEGGSRHLISFLHSPVVKETSTLGPDGDNPLSKTCKITNDQFEMVDEDVPPVSSNVETHRISVNTKSEQNSEIELETFTSDCKIEVKSRANSSYTLFEESHNLETSNSIEIKEEIGEKCIKLQVNSKYESNTNKIPNKNILTQILEESVSEVPFDSEHYTATVGLFMKGAQEPWPKDVKLYQPFEVEQILLPDNANCLAVQAFLKMCNLHYEVEPRANAEFMSPSGKVPFIKCGAFVISELEGIVHFVSKKDISLTSKLDDNQKSELRAYTSLVRNVLENAELYICWCDSETYNEVTKPRYGCVYPWPLNLIQTWTKKYQVVNHLKVMKWYEKSLEDVYGEVERCCESLSIRLQKQESPYFFGNQPTELDALVFGHLFAIITTPLPNSHLANIVKNFPLLIDLAKRIETAYFKKEINGS
ncbi:metaxin-2 isoform X2 [Agrilus planipennis]|uniref:Metaxin-2 isoform X2 n=1 Tax=Agrilus planipennis TaxID=224129 RepID=A0A1W4X7M8_AGRPL|nr:metaxin-2 isoform X2 [Agrilus planipennis]